MRNRARVATSLYDALAQEEIVTDGVWTVECKRDAYVCATHLEAQVSFTCTREQFGVVCRLYKVNIYAGWEAYGERAR